MWWYRIHLMFRALNGRVCRMKYAGEDGLEHLRRLIVSAGRSLKPGGFLVVEIGDGQADGVQEIFSRADCYSEVEVHPDLGGTQRVVTSRRRAEAEEL